jgi:hypothetical protein
VAVAVLLFNTRADMTREVDWTRLDLLILNLTLLCNESMFNMVGEDGRIPCAVVPVPVPCPCP